jgi:tight adherence protein C
VDFLLIVLVFAATASLVLAASSLTGQRRVRQRLARLSGRGGSQALKPPRVKSALAKRDSGRLLQWLGKLGGSARPVQPDSAGPLRERMIYAGYRAASATSIYMGLRMALALILPLCVLALPPAWALSEWRIGAILCAASGLGYVLPSWYLGRRVKWRQRKIQLALPDALDLMVVCVEAGFGINASLARVAKEFAATSPIFSSEIELVSLEIRAGKTTVEALRGLSSRTGVGDIKSLVALLVQTERFGTSVADALRVHSDAMRVQRMQRAEEEAGKAPLKMIFPTVVIFAATLIVLLTPAMLQFNGMFEQ